MFDETTFSNFSPFEILGIILITYMYLLNLCTIKLLHYSSVALLIRQSNLVKNKMVGLSDLRFKFLRIGVGQLKQNNSELMPQLLYYLKNYKTFNWSAMPRQSRKCLKIIINTQID